jgi:hypothetical protein
MLNRAEWKKLKDDLARRMNIRIQNKYIRAIYVNSAYHWQPPMYIEVGRESNGLEKDSPKEMVLAIFDATVFLVVTEARGLNDTLPYFFSRSDVTRVIEE